jgi:hypothetical protein
VCISATIGLVACMLAPLTCVTCVTCVAGVPAVAAAEVIDGALADGALADGASIDYVEVVWAAGWQGEIDACRGAVDVGDRYGTPVIAEHWSCGGSRFPGEGSTIALTGVITGIFRVGSVVVVLNAATDKAAAIPHGFDLLYQTCRDGSSATMSFTELTRIG